MTKDKNKDERIEELERVIRDRDIEIDRLKKEYRVGLEREIVELEGLVENLEWVIDELEGTSQVQDRVQVEVRDRCEIDKGIKDAINKSEVGLEREIVEPILSFQLNFQVQQFPFLTQLYILSLIYLSQYPYL